MKKIVITLMVSLLLIALAGTVYAAVETKTPVSAPDGDDFYRQMYEYCHGPNGMMNRNPENSNGTVTQGFNRMMGYGGMMMGLGSGSMMAR